ncbi:MAG: hypothetical protein Q9217_000276 [Psora testacea]
MSKLLIVFGATGRQGGSVINTVLNDPELSKQYKVCGITRDLSKPAARALQQLGIELRQADADEKESLKLALKGAHTVVVVTVTIYDALLKQREIEQGRSIADAATAAGAHYLVYSTAVHAGKISGRNVDVCDAKAEVEEYIRTLPIKSAFFAPGVFMQNFAGVMVPRPTGEFGVYALYSIIAPEAQIPLIETVEDSGKYIGAILAQPEKYESKVFYAATKLYSFNEIAQYISKATEKTVKSIQQPENVYRGSLPPQFADHMVNMALFFQDPGYFGPETKELVEWTAQQARGKLTTFEEYLAKNPFHLE